MEKGDALQPKQQGMPMDASYNGQSKQGVAPECSANLSRGGLTQNATLAGLNQGAFVIVMVDARHDAFFAVQQRSHEPELIVARHIAKGRHMKNLARMCGQTPLGLWQ